MLATLPQFSIPVERQPAPAYISFVNGGTFAAMEKSSNVSSAERWEWYAAGDKAVAPRARPRAWANIDPDRVVFEIGLALAVPLLLAALAGVVFA
ncbi:MAG: hypothetical protein WDM86_19275 [Rhizomicrobium sp.]